MLQRWKNAVRVMFSIWVANDTVLSRIMQRLLTLEEKDTKNSSIMMGGAGVCCDLMTVDLKPMCHASVLLPFNLEKFLLIQHSRQVVREVG